MNTYNDAHALAGAWVQTLADSTNNRVQLGRSVNAARLDGGWWAVQRYQGNPVMVQPNRDDSSARLRLYRMARATLDWCDLPSGR